MGLRVIRWFASLLVCLAGAAAATPPPPMLYAAGTVRQSLRLPDGSVIVTGYFTAVGQSPRAGIAKLDSDGQLDSTWAPPDLSPGFASQAVALASSPDGNAVYIATNTQVAKVSASGTGASVPGFAVNVTGSVDGGNTGIRALRADGSGLYVAGAFAYINGQQRNAIARLDSSGTLDATWVASTNSTVNAIEVDPVGGFVYLAGAFVTVNGAAHLRIARLQLADGSVDATWNPSVTSALGGVQRIALSPARDTLVLAGNFSAVNATPRAGTARLVCATAALDAWNPPIGGYAVEALAATADFVYVGGDLSCCNQGQLARASTAGSGALDATWIAALDGPVHALLPDGAAGALAFGAFGHAGDVPVLAAAAISAAGVASHTLPDFEIEGSASAMAPEPSGDLLLAGDFQKVDGSYRESLFRLKAAGSIDAAFIPPRFAGGGQGSRRVLAVAVDSLSGAVYAGGAFDSVGGVAQNLVVRLDGTTGTVDPAWTPVHTSGPSAGSVQAVAVDQGFVYIGGAFTQVNGAPHANLARLTVAGELDTQFAAATNGSVSRIVVDAEADAVYIAGAFLVPRTRIARLQRSGGAFDPSWNPTFDWVITWNDVFDLELVDGAAVISTQASIPFGGGFIEVGDLVTIDASGAATELARFNQPVYDILAAPDSGSIYVAGTFQTMYALDDVFAQTSHPAGLAQLSLRPGSFGLAESWSPAVSIAGGVPGLARLGAAPIGVLAGSGTDPFGFPRPGLEFLALPPGDFLFKDGFDP